MKRKSIITTVLTCLAVTFLSGCGAIGSNAISAEQIDEVTEAINGVLAGMEAENIPYVSGVVEHYESDDIVEYYTDAPEDGSYIERYALDILEDGRGIFTDNCMYREDNVTTTRLTGEVEKTDDGYSFVYKYDDGMEDIKHFTIDGNKITGVEYYYSGNDTSIITGKYVAKDGEYGALSLEIYNTSEATITMDDVELHGHVMNYDGNWEVTASNYENVADPADEMYLDIIVSFEGDEFTYISYEKYIYGSFAGDIEAFGDLGDVLFHFGDDGRVYADVEVQDIIRTYEGNYYVDSEAGKIQDAYLYDADGNSLSLNFDYVDGMLNYSGSYSIILGAG